MAQFVYNELLTDYAVKLGVGNFGASQGVASLKRVRSITGSYGVRNRASNGEVNVERAPGAPFVTKQPSEVTLDSYDIKDHALIVPVPLEIVDGYREDDLFQEKANAAMESLENVLLSHATKVKAQTWGDDQSAFNTIYGASNVVVPATKWNASGATIEQNIATGADSIYKRSGKRPNVLAMTQQVFDAITKNPNSSIYDRVKYTSAQSITKQALAGLFELQEVIILDELYNSANPGQTQVYTDLFTGDNALLFHRGETSNINSIATLAQTFYWESGRTPFLGVEERFNDDTNSYEFKASAYFDVKRIKAECGYVLFDVLG